MRTFTAMWAPVAVSLVCALAQAATPEEAVKRFAGLHPGHGIFVSPRLSADGQLVVNAKPAFVERFSLERDNAVNDACRKWRRALGVEDDSAQTIEVYWPGGGSVHTCRDSGALTLAEWDDLGAARRHQAEWGRLFFFGGAQLAVGAVTYGGFTLSQGITMFQNRADVALNETLLAGRGAANFQAGLSARYRHPLNPLLGINGGGQMGINTAGGVSFFAGVLAGLNLFVFNGSIDVTANLNTDGSYGLVTGYTLFVDAL